MAFRIDPESSSQTSGDETSNGFVAFAAVILAAGLATLVVKIISHMRELRALRIEDWLAIASFPFAIGLAGASARLLKADTEANPVAITAGIAGSIMYTLSLLLVKLSLLSIHSSKNVSAKYLNAPTRLGTTPSRYISFGLMGFTIAYSFGSCVTVLLQCSPYKDWLDGANFKQDSCINVQAFVLGIGVLDVLTLAAILALACPVLLQRWAEREAEEFSRIRLFPSAALGSLAFLVTITRAAFVIRDRQTTLAISMLSILVPSCLIISTTLLSPTPRLLPRSPQPSMSLEEAARLPHEMWREQGEKRGRSMRRDQSTTDLSSMGSINSNTRLFARREERSITPEPAAFMGIMVETEINRTEEKRKNWVGEKDWEKS